MLLLLSLHQTRRAPKRHRVPAALADLHEGEHGVLDGIDLAAEDAQRVMELGFIPGARVTAGPSAPGGDPRVYRVDGSEVALRRETASRLKLRHRHAAAD